MLKAVASSAADATGVTAAAVLTANQLVVGADGARGVKTADTTITGDYTFGGRITAAGFTNTANGAASASSSLLSGTVFTGGTGTTTFPQMLFQPTGTSAATTWSTSGTIIGANVVSGFAGNFLDFHVAGAASVFSVSSAGSVTAAGSVVTSGSLRASSSGGVVSLGASNDVILSRAGAASLQQGAADAATATAQTLRVQSVVAGTTNANGANWTHIGSLSTGSGTSGDQIFQTGVAPGGGSPTVQATATTALTIKGETQAVIVASGKTFQLGNAATTGLVAGALAGTTNASIVITDSTGQAYRIPCII